MKEMAAPSTNEELLLEDPLLREDNNEEYTGDFSVGIHGKPILMNKTGHWRASLFILGAECSERFAYFGIASNLICYLSNILHESNLSAARSVSIWQGTCYLTPLFGAFLADAYWGRYWTLVVFSAIYFAGMCALTFSALLPTLNSTPQRVGSISQSSTATQSSIFFIGLYLVALGAGGFKPCVAAFGADQFDTSDSKERLAKGSFFNWFYLAIQIGALLATTVLVWIQDNVGWGLGFAIPTFAIVVALVSFVSGSRFYRFQRPGGSPLTRICQVVVSALRKWKVEVPQNGFLLYETSTLGHDMGVEIAPKLGHTNGFRWLDKAATLSADESKDGHSPNPWKLCPVTQVEELKILIRMFPIWATSVAHFIVYSQASTTFVQQAKVMERSIGCFTIPAASFGILFVASNIFWVLIYDKFLLARIRHFTGKEQGLSELQRIGVGLFMTSLAMVVAGYVESLRLQLHQGGPLKAFWQIPQYFLIGAGSVFTYVGNSEFFYNQSPDAMRSLCTAFALLIVAAGSYCNSLILTIVNGLTTVGGKGGWIQDDVNQGHLDYFFWLLAALCFLNFFLYIFFAVKYKPKNVI